MNTQDKLAEALRELKTIADSLPALATKVDVVIRLRRAERMAATINKIIQAHAAERRHKRRSGEWVGRKRKGHTEWRQGTEKDGGGSTNYVEPVWVWDEPELFDQWMDHDWPLWRNDPDNPNVARLRRMYDTFAAAP